MPKLYWQRAAAAGLVHGEQPFPPRSKPPRHVPRFLVPAGVPCAISKVCPLEWRPYTTKQESGFERFERYERSERGNYYHSRTGGWLMLVHRRHVVHREDTYSV
jgi:hypothetical protein